VNVVRFETAPEYEAPGHFDMRMVRLQGREAGPSDVLWLGVSELAPGGGTTLDPSPMEKLYVVLDGQVTVSNGTESVRVGRWDSVRIAPNEPRQLRNETDKPASILLAMPLGPMTPA
jgi:mannose-6-phosphate isomerase-like protein (cupin superfamily)